VEDEVEVTIDVNGTRRQATVPVRTGLADFLRDAIGLTGTNVGCEHGVCGACTVLVDGRSARSCIMLAATADGSNVTTVEGLSAAGALHPLQTAFRDHHALQCGFCTPGMLMTLLEVLGEQRDLTDGDIRVAISGNLCRCTGYHGIVEAAKAADRDWARHVPGDPA
jgi:carbon-monoxide dehydrogenase small subunit